MKLAEITKEPHEGFVKGLAALAIAFALGWFVSWFGRPSFIQECAGNGCHLALDTGVEGSLLVVASLLVGVAIVQAQNLNRLKDILRAETDRSNAQIMKSFETEEGRRLWQTFRKEHSGDYDLNDILRWQERNGRPSKTPQLKRIGEIYADLIAGFWIVSFGVLVSLALLAFLILFPNQIHSFWAHFLATFWWAMILSIVGGWWFLAMVALASYRKE